MERASTTQRLISGAKRGAVIGLLAACLRTAFTFSRDGAQAFVGESLTVNILFFFGFALSFIYLFAVGSAIAKSIVGCVVGTVLFTVAGHATVSFLNFDVSHLPFRAFLSVVSVLFGAPLGAAIQASFFRGNGVPQARDDQGVRLGPADALSGSELRNIFEGKSGEREPNKHNLYIEIPDGVSPKERCMKYEDPLTAALATRRLGAITGGGTSFNAENEIEHVGIDIITSDLKGALSAIAGELRNIKAPRGTVIRYGDGQVLDIWDSH